MNAKMKRRRGQAPLENLFALAMLLIGVGGAWLLYGPQIRQTNQALIENAKQIFGGGGGKAAR